MSSAAPSPHSSLNIFATTGLFFLLAFSQVNAQLLANGSYFQSGSISTNWLWQASGGLTHGRCPWIVSRLMSDCYKMSLDPTGNLESTTQANYLAALKKPAGSRQRRTIDFDAPRADSDRLHLIEVAAAHAASTEDYALDAYFEAFPEQAEFRYVAQPVAAPTKDKRQFDPNAAGLDNILASSSARQRNEILSWPGAPSGQTWHYTWKSYQDPSTTSNDHFFHSWQILRRDGNGGPVVTLDYTNGNVELDDLVRGCTNCVPAGSTSAWFGRTISHDLVITYGVSGSIAYSASYAPASPTVQPILKYSAKGDMGSSASLKFGNYRLYTANLSPAVAYVGDFTQTRL